MKNTIRIAYLIDTIETGNAGTEKQLINLIDRLKYDITLICLYDSSWLSKNNLKCQVICLGYKGFLSSNFPIVLGKYLQCLNEMKFDLVQTFFEDSMLVGFFGKILSKKQHRLIVSRRDLGLGSDEPCYHFFYKILQSFVYKESDGIAVNAQIIKDQIIKKCNKKINNITVIRNGIDLPSKPTVLPLLFSEFQADVWIGIVANLKPIKRIDVLLKAISHLKTNRLNQTVRTIILGDGRLKSDLVQLAVDIGVYDQVHFVGSVQNVCDYLHGVDIGVLCSDKEGLSNAILEYMSCGLPVIATDAGGNCELVDLTNGICVPAGDFIGLADALGRLINSPILRKELGSRSLAKVRQDFTWEKIIPKWEDYYDTLTKNLFQA